MVIGQDIVHKNLKVKYLYILKRTFGVEEYHYYIDSIEYCCDKMERLTNERLFGFGAHPDYPATKKTYSVYESHCYAEGGGYTEHEISFCPFCGKEIILEYVGGGNVIEE